ncbi:MAG TPA: iron-containing alcohol dehydrogenase [Gaiellaceae bacterium]
MTQQGLLAGIDAFRNHLPVDIRFGEGVVAGLPSIVRAEKARHAFVVLDAVADDLPGVAQALASLEAEGVEITRREKETGEPTAREVDAVSEALAGAAPDILIAIGGGSVIDVAKTARLAASARLPYLSVAGDPYVAESEPTIPLVTVPTTAGSGSEVSGGAVITDEATHRKTGISAPFLRAGYALVDPALTYGAPSTVTAWSGIDALAQAIAAIVTSSRTPVGTAVALEAIRLAGRALPRVVADGEDRAARQEMACASLMAGLAMNISDCGSEHSLAQALGGRFGLPHGLTIGLVLAESMDVDRRGAPELFERIADALGEAPDGTHDGSRAVRGVERILAEIDFPVLGALEVDESEVDDLAAAALEDVFIALAPWSWTADDAKGVYRQALSLTGRATS